MLNLNYYFMAQIKNKSSFRVGWYANADFQNNYFYSQYGISGAEAAKNFMEQGFYYWRAWISSTPPTNPEGDLWQYKLDTSWNGIDADFNRVVSDRFWNGGGVSGKLPLWLMMYLMQKNKKERSITIIT